MNKVCKLIGHKWLSVPVQAGHMEATHIKDNEPIGHFHRGGFVYTGPIRGGRPQFEIKTIIKCARCSAVKGDSDG
jgi:hypothetical protein